MAFETLHCKVGDHDWERERKRGKKPVNCPEHTTQREIADREAHMLKMQQAREAAAAERRRQIIVEWRAKRAKVSCRCEITPDMTLRQINATGGGCTDPYWVCGHLDQLRRKLGH